MSVAAGRLIRVAAAAAAALAATPALAHHGTASASAIGVEGPGVALETTSPLPLGASTLVVLAKSEYVDFAPRAGVAEPKRFASFETLAVGYGLSRWLSLFLFQPYTWKSQAGAGTNSGPGDPNLMLAAALKWDDGLQRVPERESLDDLADWHLGVWVASTVPVGPTDHRDARGAYFAPDMQTGFRGPSPSAGVTVLKQLSPALTALGEVSAQTFFPQRGPGGGRYQFGAETRANAALPVRAWAAGRSRVDVVPEVAVLDLRRDREDGVPLRASGGTVLYGQLGARATFGALSVGASVKRALATRLHEGAAQQGSEGLESFRAALLVSWATRL